MRYAPLFAVFLFLPACSEETSSSTDLPDQKARLVSSVAFQEDTKATHVGASSALTGSTTVKPLADLRSVEIGRTIDGVKIGAIKCSFHTKDASYSGTQFMWRGRWACLAGRNEYEVDHAVKDDGSKAYDYIHVSPVSLPAPT